MFFLSQERDPLEGPVPHLEARLCVLLSITPLAIARVLEDNATFCSFPGCTASRDMECGCGHGNDDNDHALRKQGLISSLQVLGHFTSLLCPPTSVVNAANIAAAKATSFMFNSKNVKDGITGGGCSDALVKAGNHCSFQSFVLIPLIVKTGNNNACKYYFEFSLVYA